MILSWPGKVAPGVSAAANSQVDFLASFAALTGQPVPEGDGMNALDVLLGKSTTGRSAIVQEGISGLALRAGDWKYIPPHKGQANFKVMRSGNDPQPQLYHLADDPAETKNLAVQNPAKLQELAAMLDQITGRKIAKQKEQ
jgi:arylsulfatase A-like enzyme